MHRALNYTKLAELCPFWYSWTIGSMLQVTWTVRLIGGGGGSALCLWISYRSIKMQQHYLIGQNTLKQTLHSLTLFLRRLLVVQWKTFFSSHYHYYVEKNLYTTTWSGTWYISKETPNLDVLDEWVFADKKRKEEKLV